MLATTAVMLATAAVMLATAAVMLATAAAAAFLSDQDQVGEVQRLK
jgi:hypothetical protein